MVIAMLIAAVGVIQDSPILIIGAMVVGPEFGPLAGICVAIVQKRRDMAKQVDRRAGGRIPARRSGSLPRDGRLAARSASRPTSSTTRARR